MLYLISVWIGLLFASSIAGITVLQGLQGHSQTAPDVFHPVDRLFIAVWLGIVVLATALLTLSFFSPLSFWVSSIFILSGCFLALQSNRIRREFVQLWQQLGACQMLSLFVVSAIAVALWMSRSVTWLDTGLYHYQVIQWLAQYGTIPGVTLLFGNFGFTSSWFALAAPFDSAMFAVQASTVGNGFVLLISLWHGCVCTQRIVRRQAKLTDYFAFFFLFISLFSILFIKHLSDIVVSASPDIPIIFLVGAIAWTMLVTKASATSESNSDRIHSPGDSPQHHPTSTHLQAIPLVLAAGAVTIKLTAIPLLLVAIGFYNWQFTVKQFTVKQFTVKQFTVKQQVRDSIQHPSRHAKTITQFFGACPRWGTHSKKLDEQRVLPKHLLMTSIILISFLLPMIGASIITSGCPLYPSSLFCLELPWSPSPDAIETFAAATHRWASWYGEPPAGANPFFWLLWQWFSSSRLNQLVAGSIVGMIAIATLMLCKLKQQLRQGELWIVAIASLGILFFMLLSPVLRFSFPYLILLPTLLLAHSWQKNHISRNSKAAARSAGTRNAGRMAALPRVRLKLQSSIAPFVLWLPLAFCLCISVQHPAQFLIPLPMKSAGVVQQQTNDITYFAPQNDLCWATPLPCAFEVPADVQLRHVDRGIAGGFIRRASGQ